MYRLCSDNAMCCDDNCKRCANLVYNEYLKLKENQDNKQEKCNHKWELIKTYNDAIYTANRYRCVKCGIEEEMSIGI